MSGQNNDSNSQVDTSQIEDAVEANEGQADASLTSKVGSMAADVAVGTGKAVGGAGLGLFKYMLSFLFSRHGWMTVGTFFAFNFIYNQLSFVGWSLFSFLQSNGFDGVVALLSPEGKTEIQILGDISIVGGFAFSLLTLGVMLHIVSKTFSGLGAFLSMVGIGVILYGLYYAGVLQTMESPALIELGYALASVAIYVIARKAKFVKEITGVREVQDDGDDL